MHNVINRKYQTGISTYPTLFAVVVFAFILQGVATQLQQREDQIEADAVTASITELAKAQARFIADPANPDFGTYAADPATLVASGYLPSWRTDPNYAFAFPANGIQISYTANTTADAAEIGVRFGALSNVAGTVVTVGFSDPVDLALFDEFVRISGDTMTGTLEFEAGSGANIDLNQNAIEDASSVTVTNAGSTGSVDANIGTFDTIIVSDLRINE